MAESYTNEYRNPGFPNSIMERGNFVDVNDSIGELVNQINTYRSQGKFESARILILQNADALARSEFGATNINGLFEELRNTQIYAKNTSQEIIISDSEPVAITGDIWIEVDV